MVLRFLWNDQFASNWLAIIDSAIPESIYKVTSFSMTVLQSMKLGIDVNRHKEIIVKAVSAILLLLLKHFKLNHIYQFEFMSQHLVFANCIPLVLKFFNQNIMTYIGSKNVYVYISGKTICMSGANFQYTNLRLPFLCNRGSTRTDHWKFRNRRCSSIFMEKHVFLH